MIVHLLYNKNRVSCFCFVSFVLLAFSKVGFLFLTQQKLEVFFFCGNLKFPNNIHSVLFLKSKNKDLATMGLLHKRGFNNRKLDKNPGFDKP